MRFLVPALVAVLALVSSACGGGDEEETVSNTSPVINGTLVGSGTDARGTDFAIWKSSFTFYIKYPTHNGFAVDPFFTDDPDQPLSIEVADCATTPGFEVVIKGMAMTYTVTDDAGNPQDMGINTTIIITHIDAPRIMSNNGYSAVQIPEGYEAEPSVAGYAGCAGSSNGTQNLFPEVPVPQENPTSPAN